MRQTKLSASNPAVGEETSTGAPRGEHGHGPGAQPEPACRLGNLGSAWLRPGTEPDTSTRQHQAHPWGCCRHTRTRNSGRCSLGVMPTQQRMCRGSSRPAHPKRRQRIRRHPCSSIPALPPRQLAPRSPGLTAGAQPLSAAPKPSPRVSGRWLAQHPLPAGSPPWGYPFGRESFPPAF